MDKDDLDRGTEQAGQGIEWILGKQSRDQMHEES